MAGKTESARLDELNQRLDGMVASGAAVSREWLSVWRDGVDYVFNNQLVNKERSEGWQDVVFNRIWPSVRQTMALMMQRRPRVIAQAQESSDTQFARQTEQILQWQFERLLDMPSLLATAIMDGAIYGMFIAKVFWEHQYRWDGDRKRWIGAPRVNLLYPPYFGSDPESEKIDDAAFVFCRRRVSVDWAKWRWPSFKDEIEVSANAERDRTDIWGLGYEDEYAAPIYAAREDQQDGGVQDNPYGRISDLLGRARGGQRWEAKDPATGQERAGYVTIEEVYFRDYRTTHQVESEDVPEAELLASGQAQMRNIDGIELPFLQDGSPLGRENWPQRTVREYDEPMYPQGRYVLRLGGTDKPVIVNPREEDQIYPYKQWPFVVGVNYVLPHVWQGMNDVEMQRGVQDWVNVSASHLLNYLMCFGDSVLKVEQGAVQDDPDSENVAEKLAPRAGAIWKVARGRMNGIERVQPPTLGQGVPAVFHAISQEQRDIAGVQEVTLGRETTKRETATENRQRNTNARLPVSLKLMLQDRWTVKVLERVAELNEVHMTPGERVRVLGPKGMLGTVEVTAKLKNCLYDLRLEVGTALPFDRDVKKQEYLELAGMLGPAIFPELLEIFEIENRDEILQRHEAFQRFLEWQNLQAELAARSTQGGKRPSAQPAGRA